MFNPAPLTPLGQKTPHRNNYKGILVSEVTDVALASVATRNRGAARTLAVLRKLAPVPVAGRLSRKGRFAIFWMAPECWMVEAPLHSHENLAGILESKLRNAASVTEQNDAWCRFDMEGEHIDRALSLLTPIDAGAMRGGEATPTAIHHMDCIVLCRKPEHVSVLGPRSGARSLYDAIATAISAAL